VVAVSLTKPAGVPPLAEIRKSVEARYREAEADKLAKADADAFLGAAREKGWTEALRQKRLSSAFTESFTAKSANLAPLGLSEKAAKELLATPQTGAIAPESYAIQGKHYALRLATVIPADMAGLDAEREKVRAQLLPSKREQVYEEEMKKLRAAAKIEKNPALFPPRG
jgi:peptidyl-prolyl cis-trans isomerase D